MREYVLITVYMIEYTSVNLNKQSFAYARILNVSDAGHCIKSPYILLSSYWDRRIKNEHFPKGIMRESTCATRHFQGKGGRGFVELGRFDNYVVKNTRKRGPARKHFRVFLLDALKTTFWMEGLTQRWTQWRSFIPKPGHFFDFQKEQGGDLPSSPLGARL